VAGRWRYATQVDLFFRCHFGWFYALIAASGGLPLPVRERARDSAFYSLCFTAPFLVLGSVSNDTTGCGLHNPVFDFCRASISNRRFSRPVCYPGKSSPCDLH
jgi:hypothetical protein